MSIDPNARTQLQKLVVDFTEAFNREDIDEVMSYFSQDGIYDEFNGTRNIGKEAIRTAFQTQFSGAFGKMRFYTEDIFLDIDQGKAMIRWVLTLEEENRSGAYRGLDLLHFTNGKLVEKHTYCKAKIPFIRKKEEMTKDQSWPEKII